MLDSYLFESEKFTTQYIYTVKKLVYRVIAHYITECFASSRSRLIVFFYQIQIP